MAQAKSRSPSDQDARDFTGKGLRHLPAAHVGDAVKRQIHEGGVAAAQVVLDGVVDQADQVAVGVDQHRDEQVTLKATRPKTTHSRTFCET